MINLVHYIKAVLNETCLVDKNFQNRFDQKKQFGFSFRALFNLKATYLDCLISFGPWKGNAT